MQLLFHRVPLSHLPAAGPLRVSSDLPTVALLCSPPCSAVNGPNQPLKYSFPAFSAQGILFSTSKCMKSPTDLLKIYLHESSRVYRDKLVEEQDIQAFDKLQTDTLKKFYEVRSFFLFFFLPRVQRGQTRAGSESLGWLFGIWTCTSVANTARRRKNIKEEEF